MIIQRELTDPRITGFPSVTRVKVAEDLSVADVYLTIMGTAGQQSAALNAIRHSGGLMRSRLTKELDIRQVPFLKFHIDEQLKKELAVMELLAKVDEEKAEMQEREARYAAIEAEEEKKREAKRAAIEAQRRARDEALDAAEAAEAGEDSGSDEDGDGEEDGGEGGGAKA